MKRFLPLLLLLLSASALSDCVILLHGLARTALSMKPMEEALKAEQHEVVNIRYPSRDASIEVLAEKAITPALDQCPEDSSIHFVTHSMGGLLVRQYLSIHKLPTLKYVVMLGPPNRGTELVDKLGAFPGFHFVNGDAGLQMGTGETSWPNRLGPAGFNVGIIAGNISINWILSALIPGTDDGKVSVENTRLEAMNDHIEMAVTHTFMMRNKAVISQVVHYLEYGNFKRAKPPA